MEKEIKAEDLKNKIRDAAVPVSHKVVRKVGSTACKAATGIILTMITSALRKTLVEKTNEKIDRCLGK